MLSYPKYPLLSGALEVVLADILKSIYWYMLLFSLQNAEDGVYIEVYMLIKSLFAFICNNNLSISLIITDMMDK